MLKKRRLLGLGVAVGLAAALLVGAVAASAKPKQSVTIKMLTAVTSKQGLDVMIANFERVYPNIHVEATYVDSTAYGPLLLTQLQAGSEPDVFTASLGGAANTSVFPLAAQGRLLDLSGSPWVKRVLSDARKYSSRQHKIYALPLGYNLQGLMYNKDLFASLGLQEPTTFNELLALCGKIRAAGKIPIAAGLTGISAQVNLSLQLMVQFVYSQDRDWTLHRIQKKVTFAGSPGWQRALQALVQMKDANCFQPAPAATSAAAQYAMTARGEAVMMPASSQEGAVVQSINPNFKWAMFPVPGEKASDTLVATSTAGLNLVASARTQHLKEAKTFINFVGRPKQNTLLAKIQGVISGADFKAGIFPAYAGASNLTVRLAKSGKVIFSPVTGWPRPDKGLFLPAFTSQLPGLFTGQKTPDQILAAEDQLWDRP